MKQNTITLNINEKEYTVPLPNIGRGDDEDAIKKATAEAISKYYYETKQGRHSIC